MTSLATRVVVVAVLSGLLAACVLAIGGPGALAPTQASAGPALDKNVLLVMTDDQRASDTLPMRQTRRLVAGRGATFRNSFSSFPLCCPSRVTHLTGQYAHSHGILANRPPLGGARKFIESGGEQFTVPLALQQAGYRTGHVGKYLGGYQPFARQKPAYVPPGYDYWAGALKGMVNWYQVLRGELIQHGNRESDYQTDVLARQASRFIGASAKKDEPFFLTVTPPAPHLESSRSGRDGRNPRPAKRHKDAYTDLRFPRPPSFNERDVSDKPPAVARLDRLSRAQKQLQRDRYRDRLASLLAVDDLMARLMAQLESAGELKDTLVIFTSDNGYFLGEHRLTQEKILFYEEAIKVPLYVRAPGIPRGVKIDSSVVNVDVPATIYDFAGVEPLVEQEGVSLFDVVADPGDFDDREILVEHVYRGRAGAGIRTPTHLYAEYETAEGSATELYDLEEDPFQLESLHDDSSVQGLRNQLANRLDALRDCTGAECRP